MMCESLVTVDVGGMCLQGCIQVPGSMQCHPFTVGGGGSEWSCHA